MWTTMLMSLRNLRRRLSRTLLTIAALAFGSFMLVAVTGLSEGTYSDMIKMATSSWNGQMQVLHEEYQEKPSLYKVVKSPGAVMERLESDEQVLAVSARVEAAGLFSVGTRTVGGALTGVMPEREVKVSTLANTVSKGTFLGPTRDPEALPIILGDGLARRLRVEIGQEVVYMGQAADGSTAAELFELVGILDSGIDAIDASMAMIRIQDAQELFVLGDAVHRVVVKTDSAYTVDRVQGRHAFDKPLVFNTWEELMPEVRNGIDQKRESGSVLIVIIMMMVMLGTVNTLMMSVFERTKEFGVMKALGTPRWQIVSMVLWEGAWMSIIGVGLGVLLGSALTAYMGSVGLEMFEQPVEFAGMNIDTIHPANTLLGNVIYPGVLTLASILGATWPAWRAANLDPVAALREL